MISICRDTTSHVKRWRDGNMVRRLVAAGMLNAERSFRRIKGCKDMPVLVAALRAHAARVTHVCDTQATPEKHGTVTKLQQPTGYAHRRLPLWQVS